MGNSIFTNNGKCNEKKIGREYDQEYNGHLNSWPLVKQSTPSTHL